MPEVGSLPLLTYIIFLGGKIHYQQLCYIKTRNICEQENASFHFRL